jgi:hypothetical protein
MPRDEQARGEALAGVLLAQTAMIMQIKQRMAGPADVRELIDAHALVVTETIPPDQGVRRVAALEALRSVSKALESLPEMKADPLPG